nr:8263_t:CDS:2 [Entrophospora candida]
MNNTKRSSSSFPQIKIPFPPIINLAELLQPNKSFSLFDEPHKPSRAPNAFIIYRKVFVKVARDEGHNLPMTAISSMASISWEKEPEEVKAEYKRISKEAHLKKKAMFPKDKRKKRKETWNVVSFQGPNLLKHYEVNHDDDEELDEDSNDISVIVNIWNFRSNLFTRNC